MTITQLPTDEVERVLALQDIVMEGGQRGIAARLMKDVSPQLLRIVKEEFERSPVDCMIALMSFQVNVVSNIIDNTALREDSDVSFNGLKEIFCAMMDETAADFREREKRPET